jgi:hypothetical protein
MPPFGEQIPRLDRICIDQSGLAIPDIGKRILDEAVNCGYVICAESGEVSRVGSKHLIPNSLIYGHAFLL